MCNFKFSIFIWLIMLQSVMSWIESSLFRNKVTWLITQEISGTMTNAKEFIQNHFLAWPLYICISLFSNPLPPSALKLSLVECTQTLPTTCFSWPDSHLRCWNESHILWIHNWHFIVYCFIYIYIHFIYECINGPVTLWIF
jgi:hypothetical protein